MGRTLTNNSSLSYAIETTLGVLTGTPDWKLLEPNAINTLGASITTVARSPISKNRQRKKGTTTDLDSSVEFDSDLTLESFVDFIEGFMFSSFIGPIVVVPTAVSATAYTVPTMSIPMPEDTLVYGRGFTNSENNGLKEVAAAGSTTSIPIQGGGMVIESPTAAQNVTLDIAGFRFAVGDLEVDANGNLVTSAKDLTELDLTPGQSIWVGGELAANQFAVAANVGYARVVSVTTNLLTIDKKSSVFTIDNGATKLVDLYFGRFVRNVPVDDSDFLERSFTFEEDYPGLAANGVDSLYEYAAGNFCNTLSFELPLANKATMSLSFIGTDTTGPGVRTSPTPDPFQPVDTGAFNTSADIARLRIQEVDETGLTTDFKSLTLTINNNVSPEKVLGQLGAKFMNAGNFEVDIDAQLLFSNADVVAAIRDNTTLTLDFAIDNDDGAILVDLPSMTLGGGDKELPVNESVLINTTSQAFEDALLGYSMGISIFPFKPTI